MDNGLALEMRGLSVFEGGTVSGAVDLKLERGRAYALVGTDGSGKTELLRAIVGLDPFWRGELSLLGAHDPAELAEARAGLGSLVDRASCFRDLSLGQNLRALCIALGKKNDPGVRALLRAFNVSAATVGNRRMKHATTGELLLYGVIAALLNEPALLLLDEPLEGLDPKARAALEEILETRCAAGMTALITDRNLSEIFSLSAVSVFIFLKKGRIAAVCGRETVAARAAQVGDGYTWADIQRELGEGGAS